MTQTDANNAVSWNCRRKMCLARNCKNGAVVAIRSSTNKKGGVKIKNWLRLGTTSSWRIPSAKEGRRRFRAIYHFLLVTVGRNYNNLEESKRWICRRLSRCTHSGGKWSSDTIFPKYRPLHFSHSLTSRVRSINIKDKKVMKKILRIIKKIERESDC